MSESSLVGLYRFGHSECLGRAATGSIALLGWHCLLDNFASVTISHETGQTTLSFRAILQLDLPLLCNHAAISVDQVALRVERVRPLPIHVLLPVEPATSAMLAALTSTPRMALAARLIRSVLAETANLVHVICCDSHVG